MSATTLPQTGAASWKDYLELSKARIVVLVLVTTAAGFLVARPWSVDLLLLLQTLIGTAFVAGGTNALNQYVERDFDGLMARTRRRPLPDGRMSRRAALRFSLFISAFGVLYLTLVVNPLSAALALLTLVSYLFVYTPLKRKSTSCTLIGAAPGAVPPMIGWAAAAGALEPGTIMLFAILFLWQMPHFLAISWIYRTDYANAGFVMLSRDDADGSRTATHALGYALLLVAVTALGPAFGIGGAVYLGSVAAAGAVLLATAWSFRRAKDGRSAKRLFHTSNLYLLLIMTVLVAVSFA